MMRKSEYALWTLLVLAVLAAGSTMVELGAQPDGLGRQLGDLPAARSVRRGAGARARRLCREARGRQADRIGDQRHADGARPAFRLSQSEALPRHAGADARRVRRPRHRGHHGERRGQSRRPDRGYAGIEGGHSERRSHHRISTRSRSTASRCRKRWRRCAGRSIPPITLTIVRKGVEDPFDVKVVRDVIHINPVKYSAEGRRRLYQGHHLQRADHGQSAEGDRGSEEADRSRSSRAMSSTCATIPAACSIRRSRCPIPSSIRAPSC